MSIQSEITRIAGNVSDSLDAVADKGVTVPSGSNSDDLAGLIALIPTASGEDGYVWQDAQGYVHLSDEQGTQPIMDSLTVSASGTYTPQSGHAYSSVTVPSGSATTPATSVTANPSISVNSSGLITATASATKSVTPTVSGGYVTSGTAGTVTVSGSNTSQLSTQGATTITPTESEQTAVASGKYTTGIVKVGAISSEYVGSDIARYDSSDAQVSGNTIIFPAGYYEQMHGAQVASGTAGTPTATKGTVSNSSVTVTPSVTNTTGYITGGTKTGTAVTVTASELVAGNTITADDSGNWNVTNAQTMVIPSGTAGTPTATKGTVSNHSISVTPSVTNTSGWINGSTKTGTAVTVSASELVSGSQTITANANNIDVTNLASVNVNVQPSYTATLTSSGMSGTTYVKYDNVNYYTANDTFTFHGGDTLRVVLAITGQSGTVTLIEDGVTIGSWSNYKATDYTLPSANIEIALSVGTTSASCTITTQSSATLITKTITTNGTYDAEDDDADGYSSVTVNVSGGGSLKMGVIRPDAELVKTWSDDFLAVDDVGITIPAYSTSAQTLIGASTIEDAPTLDLQNYSYYMLSRILIIPIYNTSTVATSRNEYYIFNGLYEIQYAPANTYTALVNNTSYTTAFANIKSTTGYGTIYWSSTSALGRFTSSYGVYQSPTTPSISTDGTLIIYKPSLNMRGSTTYLTSAVWSTITDIRQQYKLELYRVPVPVNSNNIRGFNFTSQEYSIINNINNGGTLT